MNNTENELAPLENVQIGLPAQPVPEQSFRQERHVFRPISFVSLIHQWQPMGIRITVQIPFISNDYSYICLIRNTPYIPNWTSNIQINGQNRDVLLYNNTRNVYLGIADDNKNPNGIYNYPGNYQIRMAHYDFPPPLATLAMAFRKWRGGMQYRFRQIANFATQGYPFVSVLKNVSMPIGIYDEYNQTPVINDLEDSYKEGMMNAYVPCDTGMFRHIEVTVPWEYPTPYYDHYAWIANRIGPGLYKEKEDWFYAIKSNIIEPHADNWVVLGIRGAIDSTKETASSIQFELEYRAMEDFQFSDPGLPIDTMCYGKGTRGVTDAPKNNNPLGNSLLQAKVMPSNHYASNGVDRCDLTGNLDDKPVLSMTERMKKVLNDTPYGFGYTDSVQIGDSTIKTITNPPTSKPNLPLYKECTVDKRSGQTYTYCKTQDDVWKTFKGDHRDKFTKEGKYYPTRIERSLTDAEIAEAHYNMRNEDRQF